MTPRMQIPPLKVCFSESDRREILARIDRCLERGFVAQGEHVEEFERRFAEYVGCRHAIALSSGGSALEAAMRGLDVHGREVLVPTNTFLATAAGVLAAGGDVKLLDIDSDTLSPSVELVERAVGPSTAGLILVHIGGIISPDIQEIRALCDARGIWLFEDCAHAHGSTLGGVRAGMFGVGGAYSFFATKVITCGEGGMLVTDDDQFADRVRLLRNYGKPNPWETYCVEMGANWRLNELAAIVGVAQLKRLDEFITWREQVAARYTERLGRLAGVRVIQPTKRSSWYKYIVVLPEGVDRGRVRDKAKEQGVTMSGGVYDTPLHRQPAIVKLGLSGSFHEADRFSDRHVCLPIYLGMTVEDVDYVSQVLASLIVDSGRVEL